MIVCVANELGDELREWRKLRRMSQAEVASHLGITRSYYANLESGQAVPKAFMPRLAQIGFRSSDVSAPLIPAPLLQVPVPYIGFVSAGSKVDWYDPYESETFAEVPPEMAEERGRFACRVSGDSMFDLLWPEDLIVFHPDPSPRIGLVCLFVSHDRVATVKQLKHNGREFVLHALNPSYEDIKAEGRFLGYLVGIVRKMGTRKVTVYDKHGITP